MHLSIFLFWIGGYVLTRTFREPVLLPLGNLLLIAWFFRRALEHARRPPKSFVTRWFRILTTLHVDALKEPGRRVVPFALSLLAGGIMLAGPTRAASWFLFAVCSAAALVGQRAGEGEFTAWRYGQDLLFGAEGRLVTAALAVAGLPLVSLGVAHFLAGVIVFSCGMMAVSEEPLRLTRPPSRKRLAKRATLPVRSFTRGGH